MPRIKTVLAVAVGAALGGALVSILVPQTGHQTRAMLRAMLIKHFDNLLAKAEQKLEDAYERAVSEQYSPEEPTAERSFF
ncbi:MAG: YtxH domain-containing protein [Saprospiraceae bacterium]|nr:YtxH domain-containing protein [Saprospiraceae bacterium]